MLPWTLFVARRGARQHRGLVALVLVVQVVAVALAAAFPALLAATEQRGVRQALAASAGTGVTIVADQPTGSVERTARGAARALDRVVGGAARTASATTAVSIIGEATASGAHPFLGELPARAIAITSGAWAPGDAASGILPVAVPRSAAGALGAAVGSTLALRFDAVPVRVRVAALYDPVDPDDAVWTVDPLAGEGDDPAHVDPDHPYGDLIDVAGPLLVAPGALDRVGVAPGRVVLASSLDFRGTTVADVDDLAARLQSIDQTVAVTAGDDADSVRASTGLEGATSGVLAQLLITRTTAAVAGLLLLVLAIAVLVQAALLLDAAQADQRALLAARGATRRQLVGLAGWGALAAAVVDLAVGVPVGAAIASVVRGEPTPPTAGSWAAGAAVAAVVAVVRLLPRIRAAERTATRSARSTGVMRTGADLALVAVAGVLGWQLLTRPVDAGAGVDPVLVAAPAVLVLASALVALRLVPLIGRAGEVAARRTRGAVGALVGWELSRRSSRATATVLLVALAIATGAFGAVSEATWLRSQRDQAALAVGAPVRVPAAASAVAEQGALLADDPAGTPQPALRRGVDVLAGAPTDVEPVERPEPLASATVLALTGPARAMLDRGRLRQEGGAAVADLRTRTPAAVGVALPDGARTLRAVVRLGEPDAAIAGAAAELRAVLEGAGGLLTVLPLGVVDVDGTAHALHASVPARGMRLVGMQVHVLVAYPAQYSKNEATVLPLRVVDLRADRAPLAVPAGWTTTGATGDLRGGLGIAVGRDLLVRPVSAATVGWTPVTGVRGVWTRDLVTELQGERGGRYLLSTAGVQIPCTIAGAVARVPGSGEAPDARPASHVVVVDQQALSRFLVQSGDVLPQADQWWVDVAPERVPAWLAAHEDVAAGGAGADGAVALADRLTAGPLRLATTQTLHLLLAAAVALGLVGFAIEVVAGLDARRREMAQLRAIGVRRGVLERMLALESAARAALGGALGVVLGVLLGALAAPRLVVGPDGGPPVPAPLVVLPGAALLVLAVGAVVAALVAALLIARTFRGIDPARILREGEG